MTGPSAKTKAKSSAAKQARLEAKAARERAQQEQFVAEIGRVMRERAAALEKSGAEEEEVESATFVFEMLNTAAFISCARFGPVGGDPGLVIAVYDRIMGRAETLARSKRPFG